MALAVEGFDWTQTLGDLTLKWTHYQPASFLRATAALGTAGARGGSGNGLRYTFTTTTTGQNIKAWIQLGISDNASHTIYIGFSFRTSQMPPSGGLLPVAAIVQSSQVGNPVWAGTVNLNSSGNLSLCTGASTVADSGYTGTSLVANTWYYIECKFTLGSSLASGSCQVAVNGTVTNSSASSKTFGSSTTLGAISIGGPNSQPYSATVSGWTVDYDDFYAGDSAAISSWPLGDCRVDTLFPNGVGASSQWTASGAGANYLMVSETPWDGDTTFVSTSGVGNRDSYTLSDLPINPTAIYGVQLGIILRGDGTSRSLNWSLRIGGTYYDGSTVTDGTTPYILLTQNWTVSPATSVAWTASEINSMEAGIKLDS